MSRWLLVEVYRSPHLGDCTLGGVTSREDLLYVPCETGPHEDPPELLRLAVGMKGGLRNFVPELVVASGQWSMFGGNFVWCCDSRFRETYGDRPVAVHDRVER